LACWNRAPCSQAKNRWKWGVLTVGQAGTYRALQGRRQGNRAHSGREAKAQCPGTKVPSAGRGRRLDASQQRLCAIVDHDEVQRVARLIGGGAVAHPAGRQQSRNWLRHNSSQGT
jgi:hypothetical protein